MRAEADEVLVDVREAARRLEAHLVDRPGESASDDMFSAWKVEESRLRQAPEDAEKRRVDLDIGLLNAENELEATRSQ